MSQYSQRYRRYSLGVTITAALMLAGCGSGQTVVVADYSIEETALSGEMPVVADADQPESTGEVDIDVSADSVFGDIYSSFTQEMAEESGVGTVAETSKLPPIEYLYSINGGNDSIASDVPTWVTGERFLRFLQPSGFDVYKNTLYILDSGRKTMFRYQPDGEKIITVLDLTMYLRGSANSVVFSDEGYYFISEPLSSRVLKFNDQNVLVDVYKDSANLARPTKLYYDDEQKKLYVGDEVFGRIVVISKQGKILYALGKRGTAKGEFLRISDFTNYGDHVIVTDSIGKKPMQVISNDGEFVHAYTRRVLSIPSAIAVDTQERIYVADHSDDSIRIFMDGELRWRFGGPGAEPGKFREITQMKIYESKLYVLDSLNRRIQVFQIND